MAEGAPEAPPVFWLVCRAGRHLCALELDHVVETMRPLPIEALSGAPPCVRGLCIHRGLPVPVVDAALLLGQEATRAERLVAIRAGGRTVALAFGSVLGVFAFATGAVAALPPLLREAASEAVSAIGRLDDELVLFLGAARIVPEALLDGLAAGPAP